MNRFNRIISVATGRCRWGAVEHLLFKQTVFMFNIFLLKCSNGRHPIRTISNKNKSNHKISDGKKIWNFNRKWTAVRICWTRFTVVKMSNHSVKNQRKFKTREFKVSIKRFSNFYITRQIAASYRSKYVTWSSGLKQKSYMEPSLVALYKMDSKNVPI